MSQNSLSGKGMDLPSIINSKTGVIIRHKEYLGDIVNTNLFANGLIPINPGLTSSFPWLGTIANSFEEYEWRGLIFHYRSMSSDTLLSTNATTALGTVIMGTQYDVLEDPFTSKTQMENHQFSNSRKPSESFSHEIECARSQTAVSTRLYTRPGAILTSGDPRLYDIGNFQICTQGMQGTGTGVIGELWCTYEIQLYKAQIPDIAGQETSLLYDHWRLGGTQKLAAIWGDTPILQRGSSIGTTLVYSSGIATLTIPASFTPTGARYLICGNIASSTAANTVNPMSPGQVSFISNGTGVGDFVEYGTGANFVVGPDVNSVPLQNASSANAQWILTVKVTNPNVAMVIAFTTITGGVNFFGACNGDVRIVEINPLTF